MSNVDETFTLLSRDERNLINNAFLIHLPSNSGPIHLPSSSGGGGGGGGFLVEEELEAELNPDIRIPLASIPDALRATDLPHRDPKILNVFRNAASGWDGDLDEQEEEALSVSLADFRSVCAVLVQNERGVSDQGEDPEFEASSSPEVSDDGSDDDYDDLEARRPTKRRRKTRQTRSEVGSDDSGSVAPLDSISKEICLDTFALFFPDITAEDELRKQRITIPDLQRICKLLGTRIKVEEMVEMLNVFSPSGSVDLEAFENIMLKAEFIR